MGRLVRAAAAALLLTVSRLAKATVEGNEVRGPSGI